MPIPFELSIPRPANAPLNITLNSGDILFVLGANGSGKSALMHHFFQRYSREALWITAHRQSWFPADTPTLSPAQLLQLQESLINNSISYSARWRDDYAQHRIDLVLHKLIDAVNFRARTITKAVDNQDLEHARSLAQQRPDPITIINELFRISNIPVEISIEESERIFATRDNSRPYGVAELSDGERNALFIAANVLTAKPGTLLIIDEPERHLHRSIISPLLNELFEMRSDVAFVISTHDVMLPLINNRARVLLVRRSRHNGSLFVEWDVDLMPAATGIDENLMRDILGARRKILFVEGTEQSLDRPLYTLLFPDVSVVAKASWRDVEQAVSGIRSAEQFHWLRAYGIVDNDRRTKPEIDSLREKGVYVLPVYSVESIYYHPYVQLRIAQRQADVHEVDAQVLVTEAQQAALEVIERHVEHLSVRIAEKKVRQEILQKIPRLQPGNRYEPIKIHIDVCSKVREECDHLRNLLKERNFPQIIADYPIRETPALDVIAKKLEFQGRVKYENAVRKLLRDDNEALEFVKILLGPIADDIAAGR